MYYSRTAEKTLKRLTKSFPCIVIYGPRQCGKSTLASHAFGDKYPSVTLDDTDDFNLAINNPKLFLDTHPWPVIIDEIQRAPLLLNEIKIRIDKQKEIWLKNDQPYEIMYILTGSNQFELQQGISESLAGRAGILEINSFSLAEKEKETGSLFVPDITSLIEKEKLTTRKTWNRKEIFEEIYKGGMPDIVSSHADWNDYFKSYVATYLEKDVRKLISPDNETTFRNFMSIVALRTGQEIKYEEIATSIGIDVKTVKRWLSILETSGIITLLHPFMKNLSNRIIKSPKLYFMDTGLCAYLCGWPNPEMLEKCAMSGAFFETFVISEIIKSFLFQGEEYRNKLFYYRDIDQKEVDLIYEMNQEIHPIEIKKGINPTRPNKNFKVLSKYSLPIKTGLIIDCTDRIRPINNNVYVVPVGLIE